MLLLMNIQVFLLQLQEGRDDSGTVWVVAPENILYTKQQIEEMIYFKEQYYDSFIEMVDEEMWTLMMPMRIS